MLQIIQAKCFKGYQSYICELGLSDKVVSVAEAVDNGKVTGFCIYHYSMDSVIVDYCSAGDDLYLYDGLIRAVLFLAINNEIENAVFEIEDKEMLEKLGFVQKYHNSLSNLSDFLNNCKSCKK